MKTILDKPVSFISAVPVKHLISLSILAIFSSLTPFISFWGLSKVIDTISGVGSQSNIILYIILIGIFLVTNDTFEAIRWTYSTHMEGKIFLEMKEKLLFKISNLSYIDIFENPKFLNKLNLADNAIPRFHGFFNSLAMLSSGILGSIPFFWIGVSAGWWVPFALIAGFIPSLIVKWNLEERLWALEIQNGEEYKEASIQESVLLSPQFAKELRLWNAAPFILGLWSKNRYKLLTQSTALRNKSILITFFANIFEGLADCAVVAYLYFLVTKGMLSTGNFVFAITAVIQLRQNAFTVLLFGLDIRVAFNRLKPFFDILNYKDETKTSSQILSDVNENCISLLNISFTYPECKQYVLKDINIKIKKGEKISIVGANGSGKSTLVKLISGMYPVKEGTYLFNGCDTKGILPEHLRKYFSAVYQDFARFPMTLAENIAVSSLPVLNTKNDLEKFEYLRKTFPINNSELQSESLLTRSFENGLDLSGGEWQRVALMRCAWADRDVVLLDEPTAALDPDSEHEVLNSMLKLIENKTAIIVTHRLALCKKTDRIIVMDNGTIIESGSHNDLIKKQGRYFEMYKKQGEHYSDI